MTSNENCVEGQLSVNYNEAPLISTFFGSANFTAQTRPNDPLSVSLGQSSGGPMKSTGIFKAPGIPACTPVISKYDALEALRLTIADELPGEVLRRDA